MAASLAGGPLAVRPAPRPGWLRGVSGGRIDTAGAGARRVAGAVGRGARALIDQDTIVIADFVNTTGEPVFDGALKVALAVALEQSPFLGVFPDDRLRETLRLMQRQPDERVTRALAREDCRQPRTAEGGWWPGR